VERDPLWYKTRQGAGQFQVLKIAKSMSARPLLSGPSCPWSELSTLGGLAIIDDPAEFCHAAGGWRQSFAAL